MDESKTVYLPSARVKQSSILLTFQMKLPYYAKTIQGFPSSFYIEHDTLQFRIHQHQICGNK